MARATAPQAFSWRQFKVMLRVIIRGEQHVDSTGMGFGDGDTADRRKGFWGSLGSGARKVAMGVLFLLLAAMFFMMGFMLGDLGVSPYTAFSLCVVCLVGLTVLTGLYQAVNILYFVRDLGYYLTLPVSATTVMWAKLAHFLGMSLLGDLIILPVGLGCLLANGAAPLAWVTMTIAFALSAVAVNLALVIICVPVMRFSRLAHDKDRFSRVFGGLIVVLALAIGVGSQFALQGDGLASLASGSEQLLSGGVPAIMMGILCPPSLLARPVVEGDALGALGALLGILRLPFPAGDVALRGLLLLPGELAPVGGTPAPGRDLPECIHVDGPRVTVHGPGVDAALACGVDKLINVEVGGHGIVLIVIR